MPDQRQRRSPQPSHFPRAFSPPAAHHMRRAPLRRVAAPSRPDIPLLPSPLFFQGFEFFVNIRPSLSRLLLVCSLAAVSLNSFAASQAKSPTHQELASGSALLVDLQSNQVLYSSHPDMVLPIASVTKLMTAMVTLDAKQPLKDMLPVYIADTQEMKGVYSRVRVGSQLSRHDLLLITLMSSENRAAASLAHHYPGGHKAFIQAMNDKARALGMSHTRYVEPTGLSPQNVSTASDLVKLLKASRNYPLLGQFSSTREKTVTFRQPTYSLGFRNTNQLVHKDSWNIQLTKTGFTNIAGHCLVMRTTMGGKSVAFVVLDSFGKYTHIADANRLKKWLETGKVSPVAPAALAYKQQKQAERQALLVR
jgi:D-alanyl-D-alanine endopeptidase (penicillin-binding protein 7)